MKKISLKERNKMNLTQDTLFSKTISKNIGTAHLDRCIKQFRYFRTAMILKQIQHHDTQINTTP